MATIVSGSAAKYMVNGEMLGGVIIGATRGFEGLAGGASGSVPTDQLNSNIANNSVIAALNSVYASAAGNEPAGDSESIQFNAGGGDFGGDASVKLDVSAGSLTVNASSGSMGGHLVGFSGSLLLGDGSDFSVDNAGTVAAASGAFGAIGATTINGSGKLTVAGVSDLDGGIDVNASKFTVSTAGAVVADSTITGASGSFGAIGGTTIDASGKLTVAGVSDLDGGIDVNASNFTVSTDGAVVAASTITGASGSFGAIGATSVAGSGNGTFDGIVSGSSVTAASIVGDTYQNLLGNFDVSSTGIVTAPEFDDGVAELTQGILRGKAAESVITVQAGVSGSLNLGNGVTANSVTINVAGVSGSAGAARAQNSQNSLAGDFSLSQGHLWAQGYPNAASNMAQARPAILLSASAQIAAMQTQGNAAAFSSLPYLQMQGINSEGTTKDYKIQISGGILQVTQV